MVWVRELLKELAINLGTTLFAQDITGEMEWTEGGHAKRSARLKGINVKVSFVIKLI